MKKISVFLLVIFVAIGFSPLCFATGSSSSRGSHDTDPITILDRVVKDANSDYKIQQTALNGATDTQGAYQSDYKIANTLDWVKNNINPYLQWAVYIGLSVAVILLIYNGFLLVTNALHKEGDLAKTQKRVIYILIGVLILTGFYFIIKLAVSIINSIFGGYGGATGF